MTTFSDIAVSKNNYISVNFYNNVLEICAKILQKNVEFMDCFDMFWTLNPEVEKVNIFEVEMKQIHWDMHRKQIIFEIPINFKINYIGIDGKNYMYSIRNIYSRKVTTYTNLDKTFIKLITTDFSYNYDLVDNKMISVEMYLYFFGYLLKEDKICIVSV